MVVNNIENVEGKVVKTNQALGASIKVLIGEAEGWDSHVLRVLDVEANGYTPHHQHPWPHINYVLEGEGELLIGDKTHTIKKGSYAYVPANEMHQFRNTSNHLLKFICIVPKEGQK